MQHIPSFINVDKPKSIEFETIDDLLATNAVKQWAKPVDGKPFSHFAISRNILMAIHDDSFRWWAVGYIEQPELIDLPKWEGGKYRAELEDGSHTVISSKDVISSCGSTLTLKDGSKAKNIG